MPIKRDITATLHHRQEGDPKVFERAGADLKEMGRAADQAGDQSRRSAGDVDQLEDQVRQLEQALARANKDLDHFKRTGKGIDQVRASFLNLRTAIATLGIGAVLDLLRRGLSETLEVSIRQEQALKALDAALESTGGQAGITKQELVGIAQGLQAVTNYGDEAIEEMEAILLTFTNLGREVLPEAIERVLDISTRMDGDLTSAALQVGKALNDPVANLGALSRAGIQFSDEQKNLIKTLVETGDRLGAQKIILAELETQFGGSARAARDTFGGALQSAQNVAGDLLEKIGEGGLSPALRNVAEDFTAAGSSGGEAFEEIGRVLGSLITLISILAKGAKAGMTAISGAVGIALGSIAHGVLELVDLLNEIPGLDKIIDDRDLQHIRDVVQEFIKGVAEDTEGGLRGAQEALSKDLDRLIDLWSEAGEATAGGVKDVNRELEGVDTAPLQRLQESVATFIEKVNKASGQELAGKLGKELAEEAKKLVGEFARLGEEVPEHFQKIATSLDNGTAAWRKGIQELGRGLDDFRRRSEEEKDAVRQHFQEMVDGIRAAGEEIGPEIVEVGKKLGVMVEQFDPATAAVKESGEAISDFGERAAAAADGPRDVTDQVVAMFEEMKKSRLESEAAAEKLDSVAESAASAGPKIKQGAEAAGEAAEQFKETAAKVEEGTDALAEQGEAAARAGEKLDETKKAADALSEAEQQVKNDVADLNAELGSIEERLDRIRSGFTDAAEAIRTAFANLEGFTGPLNSALDTTLGKLDQVIEKLNQVQNAGSASGAP